MKAILLSIHPKWCEKIFNGSKTIEVRKSRPSIPTPFKVYVYMTKHRWIFKLLPFLKNRFTKVIGSFVCDFIEECIPDFNPYTEEFFNYFFESGNDCLTSKEINKYGEGRNLYGWHITEPKLFGKPRELSEFSKFGYKYLGGCCVNYNCPNCIDNGWMQPPECKIDGCFLTRPPQSYYFVETDEKEEEK